MNIFNMIKQFPDKKSCLDFLEEIRFKNGAYCPHCGSVRVKKRLTRWGCLDCKSAFTVISNSLFSHTKIPLQEWFVAISMIMNAKKGISSYELAREIDIKQKSAWYMLQRIRREMMNEDKPLLKGIVEVDEVYIGGRPRTNKGKNLRGRGTKKSPVIGVVERGGNVIAKFQRDLSGRGIGKFLKNAVDYGKTLLMTDEYGACNVLDKFVKRKVIKHKERYVDGDVHTNTIEGFWSLVKRAWYGTHHHYSEKYLPLYIAESCWKYNHRKSNDVFLDFMEGIF